MTDPMIRIGHCSPDAPNVDIQVDGETAFEDVGFRDLSDYTSLAPGEHMVRIKPAGSTDTVIELNASLDEDTRYTALATGMLDDIEATVFVDDPGDVPTGKAHVRFIHASPDAPRVGISVRDGPDLFKRQQFRSASDYEQVDAGSYDLDVIPTGNREPALSLDGIEFSGGAAYSAIAVGLVEDGSLDALLVEDTVAELAADD
ncbi:MULTISPECIES: DUF4397 domain-containing protein [Salinibaculum]|uniref:DUF4397 domain-containing protein n=1 Tax=Salinibaculum TaxID=2732368 RepID=UPI0030CFBB40